MRDAPDKRLNRKRQPHAAGDCTGLSDQHLVALGDCAFEGLGAAVIAVSGGADSMFLLALAQRWRDDRGRHDFQIHVASVDHGLRAASADEAKWVATQARSFGFPAHILEWSGGKPATAIQTAARAARYDLLAGLIERLRLPRPTGLLVGHHLGDQAETFLMRLARGSGIDGLAAMPVERSLGRDPEVLLRRPLLGHDKTTLTATLSRIGVKWIEDPSNANSAYERVRYRNALGVLEDLGVGARAVANSSRRLARARFALEQATRELARQALDTHAGAFAEIEPTVFDAAPEEIRLRLMQHVIESFGARTEPVRMVKLEELVERLASGKPLAGTLGGCHVERRDRAIIATRELGRNGLPVVLLQPGVELLWDNRFRVACARSHAGAVEVRALSLSEIKHLQDEATAPAAARISIPRRAMLTLPSFWQHGKLLAAPHPSFGLAGDGSFEIEFITSRPIT